MGLLAFKETNLVNITARQVRPGDTITHPISGTTEMVRETTWSKHTVRLSFYGRRAALSMSKNTIINKETSSE